MHPSLLLLFAGLGLWGTAGIIALEFAKLGVFVQSVQ